MARKWAVLCANVAGPLHTSAWPRAYALFASLFCGCPGNPYVIGRYDDASAQLDGSLTGGRADAAASEAVDECDAGYARALLCSGFEDDLTVEWDVATAGAASLERASSRSHLGAGALHASSEGPNSYAMAIGTFPALRSGELFVRSYVYVPSELRTEIMNILYVGEERRAEPFEGIDLNLTDGALHMFSPQASPTRQVSTLLVPRDRWFCLRLHVRLDDTQGFVELSVDEQLVLESRRFDTVPTDGINTLRVGIDWSSEQSAPFDVFYDDLVVDTQSVDCM
jgi:hypothetical protein